MAGTLQAGTLELTNGATLPGRLKGIEGKRIVWDAELLGELKIDEAAIARLDSTVPPGLQLRKADLPGDCTLAAGADGLAVRCTGQAPMTASWNDLGKAPPTREASGRITTALTLERGNSASDELEIDANARWRRDNRRHRLEAEVDYEEKRGIRTNDEGSLDYQFDYIFRDDWYRYVRTEYKRDRFATLQEGLVLGVGLGRSWKVSEQTSLLVQGGPEHGFFDIQGIGRGEESGGYLLWRIDHATRLWKLDMTLFHEGDYAWLFRDRDLSQLQTKSGIELPLARGVVAEMRVDYDHIGVNIPGTDNTDIEWVFAVGYKW